MSDAVTAQNELIENIWPDTFVTEDSLGQCIVDIRRALGDEGHKLVRTFPKKGYMLDAPVSAEGSGDLASASGGAAR